MSVLICAHMTTYFLKSVTTGGYNLLILVNVIKELEIRYNYYRVDIQKVIELF